MEETKTESEKILLEMDELLTTNIGHNLSVTMLQKKMQADGCLGGSVS